MINLPTFFSASLGLDACKKARLDHSHKKVLQGLLIMSKKFRFRIEKSLAEKTFAVFGSCLVAASNE